MGWKKKKKKITKLSPVESCRIWTIFIILTHVNWRCIYTVTCNPVRPLERKHRLLVRARTHGRAMFLFSTGYEYGLKNRGLQILFLNSHSRVHAYDKKQYTESVISIELPQNAHFQAWCDSIGRSPMGCVCRVWFFKVISKLLSVRKQRNRYYCCCTYNIYHRIRYSWYYYVSISSAQWHASNYVYSVMALRQTNLGVGWYSLLPMIVNLTMARVVKLIITNDVFTFKTPAVASFWGQTTWKLAGLFSIFHTGEKCVELFGLRILVCAKNRRIRTERIFVFAVRFLSVWNAQYNTPLLGPIFEESLLLTCHTAREVALVYLACGGGGTTDCFS